jgi:hypothetical protein
MSSTLTPVIPHPPFTPPAPSGGLTIVAVTLTLVSPSATLAGTIAVNDPATAVATLQALFVQLRPDLATAINGASATQAIIGTIPALAPGQPNNTLMPFPAGL